MKRGKLIGIAGLAVAIFLVIHIQPWERREKPQNVQTMTVAEAQQTFATIAEIFNNVWDRAGTRLMTTPGAGAQGVFETTETILNNVWDRANNMLRVSGGGAGGGDFSSNTATSVDSEVVVFSGTAGKTGKRATGTGIATLTSGVLGTTTAPTGAIVGTTDTQTLTAKRVNPRVVTLTDAGTITPDSDVTDEGVVNTLSQATLFANPTGTPVDGQWLSLRIKSTTARALTWGVNYAASTSLALPTTTTGGSIVDYFGFRYNTNTVKWDFVATTSSPGGDVTGSSTTTFTNKTLNVEATGNVITTTEKWWLKSAICRNATAEGQWDTPASNPTVFTCIAGTNTHKAVADFADGGNLSMQQTLLLPIDWAGAIDLRYVWYSTNTGGNLVWQFSTSCTSDNETDDVAFGTADVTTVAAPGTAGFITNTVVTGIATAGCIAGDAFHVKVNRNSGHANDTHGGTGRLIGVELTIRRAQ